MDNLFSSKNLKTNSPSFQPSISAKKLKKKESSLKTKKIKNKSLRKEEKLSDFVVDMGDINPNKELDLFKIIRNRYTQAYMDGVIEEGAK